MNIIQRKKITIENFGVGVPNIDVEMVLGKREYKHFCNWMRGQTCLMGGVFVEDLNSYLKARAKGVEPTIID